jgi:hypothetical protein
MLDQYARVQARAEAIEPLRWISTTASKAARQIDCIDCPPDQSEANTEHSHASDNRRRHQALGLLLLYRPSRMTAQ